MKMELDQQFEQGDFIQIWTYLQERPPKIFLTQEHLTPGAPA